MTKQCRVCNEELIRGQNVKRSDVKICDRCLQEEKKGIEERKTASEDKIQCKKCKGYYPNKEYIKFLKKCTRCREQTNKNKKKKESSTSSENEENEEIIFRITGKQMFEYLKKNNTLVEDIDYEEVLEEIQQEIEEISNVDSE